MTKEIKHGRVFVNAETRHTLDRGVLTQGLDPERKLRDDPESGGLSWGGEEQLKPRLEVGKGSPQWWKFCLPFPSVCVSRAVRGPLAQGRQPEGPIWVWTWAPYG